MGYPLANLLAILINFLLETPNTFDTHYSMEFTYFRLVTIEYFASFQLQEIPLGTFKFLFSSVSLSVYTQTHFYEVWMTCPFRALVVAAGVQQCERIQKYDSRVWWLWDPSDRKRIRGNQQSIRIGPAIAGSRFVDEQCILGLNYN